MQHNCDDFRIPVTLLTGFLGSGKTTVLKHLLQQPAADRTLVIINEFGEIALDHLLLVENDKDVTVALNNGCLCCTIRHDLVNTLRDARWRFARGGSRWFDRVVIETTGSADPAPIIYSLLHEAVLAKHYRLAGIVTTVDLVNAERTLDDYPEAGQRQVAHGKLNPDCMFAPMPFSSRQFSDTVQQCTNTADLHQQQVFDVNYLVRSATIMMAG